MLNLDWMRTGRVKINHRDRELIIFLHNLLAIQKTRTSDKKITGVIMIVLIMTIISNDCDEDLSMLMRQR